MTQTLLAIVAHPDDESFGIGGTLARYAAEGVDVHIAIATDGVAGSVADGHEDALQDLVTVREKELDQAVKIIGGTLHKLGYRDSGYIDDPANHHPEAFINCDEDEAIRKVVKLIREIRPQVLITHDEMGGYFHPDHIQCWKIVTPAFHAAGDPTQYPEIGPAPYQPEKFFNTAFPKRMVKLFSFVRRLKGENPSKAGRNGDIDLTKLGVPNEGLHAKINYTTCWDVKRAASAAHKSQGGGTSNSRMFPQWFQRRYMANEFFIRIHPAAKDGDRERDLFNGVTGD